MSDWKPGDVAMRTSQIGGRQLTIAVPFCGNDQHDSGIHWHHASGGYDAINGRLVTYHRLVVIDPEDRDQVERLHALRSADVDAQIGRMGHAKTVDALQAALREFANPSPVEPTDPATRVEDRRENIWRLLADGDWVCTSGPDIGEYVAWSRLTERGPLTVTVPQ